MKAHCINCGADFDLKMEETPQPQGGVNLEFFCTDCGKCYQVAYLSPQALALRAEYHRSVDLHGSNARHSRRLLERFQKHYVGLSSMNT